MSAHEFDGQLEKSDWQIVAEKADIDIHFIHATRVVFLGLFFGGGFAYLISGQLLAAIAGAFFGAAAGSALAIYLNRSYPTNNIYDLRGKSALDDHAWRFGDTSN